MATPVLWHFPVSHFNEKARWALDFKRIPHVRKALSLDYLPRALWATGKPTLPILFLAGKAIGDSTRILEALERSNPEPALYPSDPAERRRAVELEDFFDAELGHQLRAAMLGPMFVKDPDGVLRTLTLGMNLGPRMLRAMRAGFPAFSGFYRYRHNINPATVREGPEKIRAALDRVRAELRPSGYVVGDRFTVADLAAAALLSPLVIPKGFQYPIPDPLPSSVLEIRESLSSHESWRWVEEMYARHRGGSMEVAA